MNAYKHRGWFWAGFGLAALLIAIVHLLMKDYTHLLIDVSGAAVCAAGFVMQRRKKPEAWEERYGKNDERDIAIEGRAAMLTMKVCAVVLFAICRLLLPDSWVGLALLGLLIAAVIVYYSAAAYYEDRM